MWTIQESPEVYFELVEAPELVQKKYVIWKGLVKQSGPFLEGKGWDLKNFLALFKVFMLQDLIKNGESFLRFQEK